MQFINLKGKEIVPVMCDYCGKEFSKPKIKVMDCKRPIIGGDIKNWDWSNIPRDFCTRECLTKSQQSGVIKKCGSCKKDIYIRNALANQSRNRFCSLACSATYTNTHKSHGCSRSKLERWVENQLSIIYPNLEIHYNRRDAINSELDIFLPSLNLAFELNGIFHYEPIFSTERLIKSQNNDLRKMQACLECGIELCVIDTSHQKYFKPDTSQKYLEIISSIINLKLVQDDGFEPPTVSV